MPDLTLQQAFDQATRFYQSQRLDEAASLYRQILAQQPDHAATLHLLGVVCAQTGKLAEAEQFIRRAIHVNPFDASYHANLGNVLQEQGRLDEALASYQKA